MFFFIQKNLYFVTNKLICGLCFYIVGWNSVFGIATRYKLEGPEIEYRWGKIVHALHEGLGGPPSLQLQRHQIIPGVKWLRSGFDHHPI
jgi:hypothetical protein